MVDKILRKHMFSHLVNIFIGYYKNASVYFLLKDEFSSVSEYRCEVTLPRSLSSVFGMRSGESRNCGDKAFLSVLDIE